MPLFDSEFLKKLEYLSLVSKRVFRGSLMAQRRTMQLGGGIEFADHREYTPGDDFRYLDWKAWSKTDKFYIKQFEAETNLRMQVVVDVSESMHYGADKHRKAGTLNKYDYACTAAACLAYMAVKQQDSAGMIAFDEDVRAMLPAKASEFHLDAIVQTLHASKPKAKTDPFKIMRRVAEATHGRGMIILFSDLLTDREPLLKGLEMLRARKHDVMVFHILDDDEVGFPFAGTTRFEGMEELPDLLCDPKSLREGYLEALEEYLIEVRRGCSRLGIDYSLVKTSDYMDAILAKFLHKRMATRSGKVVTG